jgi:hypothetical protein
VVRLQLNAFREQSNGKIILFVVFGFNALILLYTYQTFSAIRKKSDNIDALTCSSHFIGLFVIIEIFFISRFFFVEMTPKETRHSIILTINGLELGTDYFVCHRNRSTHFFCVFSLFFDYCFKKWDVGDKCDTKLEIKIINSNKD